MKLTHKQLRAIVESIVAEAASKKGGGRASLGFGIPEESPGYGKSDADSELGSYAAVTALSEIRELLKKLDEIGELVKHNKKFNERVYAVQGIMTDLAGELEYELADDEVEEQEYNVRKPSGGARSLLRR